VIIFRYQMNLPIHTVSPDEYADSSDLADDGRILNPTFWLTGNSSHNSRAQLALRRQPAPPSGRLAGRPNGALRALGG
jgi:hypothetical protein